MYKEIFIQKSKSRYPGMFEYPNLPEKFGDEDTLNLICKHHGNIKICARNHLRTKTGCPLCKHNVKPNIIFDPKKV